MGLEFRSYRFLRKRRLDRPADIPGPGNVRASLVQSAKQALRNGQTNDFHGTSITIVLYRELGRKFVKMPANEVYEYLLRDTSKSHRLKDIAAGVSLAPSTAREELNLLMKNGLVTQDSWGKYRAVFNQMAYDYAMTDAVDWIKSNGFALFKTRDVTLLTVIAGVSLGVLLGFLVRMVG